MLNQAVTSLTGARCTPQRPFDVAVIIPTVLRPTLPRAVRSVYAQSFPGTIQILLGVDVIGGNTSLLTEIARDCPDRCALTVFDLGYSTSVRHGGLHPARDGGVLRTVLSYAANSRHVAYLDDDNWWHEGHLGSLLGAVRGRNWAWSLRWFVDPVTRRPLCIDEWESVGPGAGFFNERFGGFVDPNCLLIDKLACEPVLRWWSVPLHGDPVGMSGDRHVFKALAAGGKYAGTKRATAYYVINPEDGMHPYRRRWIEERTKVAAPAA
jgi:hypothetical protein